LFTKGKTLGSIYRNTPKARTKTDKRKVNDIKITVGENDISTNFGLVLVLVPAASVTWGIFSLIL
jgi:hypothetical protein